MSRFSAAAVAAMALCAAPAAAVVRVDPGSGQYILDDGRVGVFHGLNAVYKLAPWHPNFSGNDSTSTLSAVDMANLRSWGFNVLRLGVEWDGTELSGPGSQPGVYNMSYLAAMRDFVDRLGGYGIYSIADMHEDSLSRKYCGEGLPDAYVDAINASSPFAFPFPLPLSIPTGPDGYPALVNCTKINFGLYLYTLSEQGNWLQLYKNATIVDAWAAFWKAAAGAFNGSATLLAYEIINEPQAGDAYSNPFDYLIPGQGDTNNLMPAYETVYGAIRSADASHIVMYEPAVHEAVLRQKSGFLAGPGGVADNDKQAFAYHIYCFNQNATGDITNVTDCATNLQQMWSLERDNKAAIGGGSFMTEFGAVGPNPSSAEALGVWADLADSALESWTYWSYKGFDDITTQNPATETLYNADGSLQMFKLQALSRTYAQAIACVPGTASMSFNTTDAAFTLSYNINAALPPASQYTTVYYNQPLWYPYGVYYTVSPPGAANVTQPEPNYLHIVHNPGASGVLTFNLFPSF